MPKDYPTPPMGENPEVIRSLDDPRILRYVLDRLRVEILMRKFGADFFETHEELTARKALETVMGEVRAPQTEEQLAQYMEANESEPLLPEVKELKDKVFACQSIEGLLDIAKQNGVTIDEATIAEMKDDAEKMIMG